MRCPFCIHDDTKVIDSRLGESRDSVRRRRECLACSQRFTTLEQVVFDMPNVAKSDGRTERFNEDKLRRGLVRAFEKRPVGTDKVERVTRRIMREFAGRGDREISSRQIGEQVMAELRKLDEVAYVRFASVYRRFQDIDAFSDELEELRESLYSRDNEYQLSLLPDEDKQ
ncbi:MAG: transcriptional regulator NrdR [Gammaproteobacteria bacterium]|nr:transcriptional regulator NrdR [Gammaproteobacteria bacterium]